MDVSPPSPSVGPAILIDVDIFLLVFTVQPLRNALGENVTHSEISEGQAQNLCDEWNKPIQDIQLWKWDLAKRSKWDWETRYPSVNSKRENSI